jgi:hypothetical protein
MVVVMEHVLQSHRTSISEILGIVMMELVVYQLFVSLLLSLELMLRKCVSDIVPKKLGSVG